MLIEGERHFKELFDGHYANLCAVAFSIVKNEQTAEDLVQNFFLKLWNNRSRINIQYSFKTYSSKAVYLLALNDIRNKRRAVNLSNIDDSLAIVSPSLDQGMIQLREKEYAELMNEIDLIIAQLPSKSQKIFRMAHYQQMKHATIATQLGISVNTVKVQMSRAYKTIRSEIKVKHLPYVVILLGSQTF
ncbi:MAG: RNA polymerase sigma-70 factor [Flavobacteriales bacterium]|nr:MAG: RNA polymerase sigma-70 factor [Flavobacteriales bacterium]